ncbi:hypothetical protein [Aquimarina pacifica]|uniref:hypothetical protein n=1 Tax=Aquimarina pacifica TaxID=1296415 RepID=UPI00046F13A4|nr:hypothetical protein [Aquimarina pacifica]
MTTVEQLIKELEKMPRDHYVLLNNNTSNSDVSVYFKEIRVKEKEMISPFSEKKQKYILLNQGAIN